MDEAMRPFFLGVDILISCPLRGSGAGFAKLASCPPEAVPAYAGDGASQEVTPWLVPSSLLSAASSLPVLELLLLPSLQAGRADQCPWLPELQLGTSLTPIHKPCCSDQRNLANGATKYFMWV